MTPQIRGWSATQVRQYLGQHRLDELNLIDVRQPAEFARAHIPGARLIPLTVLSVELETLDPDKLTIVYCEVGMRSAAAAGILLHAGFREVYNLEGGMSAWRGELVDGLPEEGRAWFERAETLGDLIFEAWLLEEGARRFYARAVEISAPDDAAVFARVGEVEDHHKAMLVDLYRDLVGEEGLERFSVDAQPTRMEGGVELSRALDWLVDRHPTEILAAAMALEATAYDRYVQLERDAPDPKTRRVLGVLAEGERRHLQQLAALIDGT